MGKGQRVRAARAVEKEAHHAEMQKKARRDKTVKIVCAVVAVVLVLSIAGGLIYNSVYSGAVKRGDIQRRTTVYQTTNQKVDAAMMSYFFYTQYNNFINTYKSSLSSFQLDTSKPLRKQNCLLSSGDTWFDYFMNQTKTQVEELVVLADKASADNMTLDEKETKTIDDTVQSYADYAKENNMSTDEVFSRIFGTGVKESDVRKAMNLSALAQKYYNKYQGSLEYSDAEIEAFFNENINDYRKVDYYTYTISSENMDDASTYPAAKAKADELAASKSVDEFKKGIEKNARLNLNTEEKTEEDLQSEVESAVTNALIEGEKYSEDSKYSEWLFNTATAGSTKIFDDEKGNYTVLYLVKAPYRDEGDTKTIRQIVLLYSTYGNTDDAENKANEIIGKMKEEGLTEDTFKEYAAQYSEDTATAQNGGLFENYAKSSLDHNVADWAYDSARKEGDFELVKSEDGVSICYYVGNGLKTWQANCLTDMKNNAYKDSLETWKSEAKLQTFENGFDKVPDIA